MKYPYTAYEIAPTPTRPGGILYRPEVPLRIAGPRAVLDLFAVIDTGADETLLPYSLNELLGVEIDDVQTSRTAGIAGHAVRVAHGTVQFTITADGKSYRWEATVGFATYDDPEDETVIMGHASCLNFFSATFDGKQRELILVPNRLFPGTVVSEESVTK